MSFAVEKRINEISAESPCISTIGTVISRNSEESSMVLDDGTGQITVNVNSLPQLGSLIRIIAMPFVSDDQVMLDAMIIQDFTGFEVDLYREILQMEERIFSQDEDYHR